MPLQPHQPGVRDAPTWAITIANSGTDTVSGIAVGHVASAGIALGNWSCESVNGGVCHAANGAGALNTISVQLPGGAAVIYRIVGVVTAAPDQNVSYQATLTVPNGVIDTDATNNQAIDTDPVTAGLFADGFEQPQ